MPARPPETLHPILRKERKIEIEKKENQKLKAPAGNQEAEGC
jgi:hypothetical protein